MQIKNLAGQLENWHGVQSDVSLKANSPKEPKGGVIPTYALILGYKIVNVLIFDLFGLQCFPDNTVQRRGHLGGGINSPRQFLNIPQYGGIKNAGVGGIAFLLLKATMEHQPNKGLSSCILNGGYPQTVQPFGNYFPRGVCITLIYVLKGAI